MIVAFTEISLFTIIGKYKKHIDFFINWCYSIYVEIIPYERVYMERSYYIFSLLAYAALMGGFNYIYKKRTELSGILPADRQLGVSVSALSLQINDIGIWVVAIIPCIAFSSIAGVKAAFYISVGLIFGYYLSCSLLSERMKIYSEVGKVTTIPSFLSHRYGDKRGFIGVISAVIGVLLTLSFTSFAFSFSASLLARVFSLSHTTAVTVCVIAVLVLIVLGGFMSSPHSDAVQCLLIGGATVILCISLTGSLDLEQSAVFGYVLPRALNLLPSVFGDSENISFFTLFLCLGWFVCCLGSPQLLTNFLRMKTSRIAPRAKAVSTLWSAITLFGAGFIGLMWLIMFPTEPSAGAMIGSLQTPGSLFVRCLLLVSVFGVLSAVTKANILMASGFFAEDIYPLVRSGVDKKEIGYVKFFSVLIFSLISGALASDLSSRAFNVLAFSISGLCSAFGPVVLFSLRSKKVTLLGGICSILAGTASSFFITIFFVSKIGEGFNIYSVFPSFAVSAAVLFLVSFLDRRKPSAEVLKEFDRVQSIVRCKGNYLMK